VGIGSDHSSTGLGEPFYVNVVADAVARLRVVHTVLSGEPLQKEMVVGVLVVELDNVVVYVLNGQGDLNPVYAYLLQLHAGHRAGGVLEQGLIYLNAHLLAWLGAAPLHVLLEDLGHQVICQYGSPLTNFPRLPCLIAPFYTYDPHSTLLLRPERSMPYSDRSGTESTGDPARPATPPQPSS
jgi:hypothetical protein